jgi:hypothetical protein
VRFHALLVSQLMKLTGDFTLGLDDKANASLIDLILIGILHVLIYRSTGHLGHRDQ